MCPKRPPSVSFLLPIPSRSLSCSPFFSSSFARTKLSNSPISDKLAAFLKNLARWHAADGLLPRATVSFNWQKQQGVVGRSDRQAEKMDPSAPDPKSEKVEKSYLSAAVESISPWGGSSRSSTPKPAASASPGEGSGLKNQYGGNNTPQPWHGLRPKDYPSDCEQLWHPEGYVLLTWARSTSHCKVVLCG